MKYESKVKSDEFKSANIPNDAAQRSVNKLSVIDNVEDLSKVKDEKLKAIIEKSIAVQNEMLAAPELVSFDMAEDMNYKLRKMYAPETIERYDENNKPLHTHTAYMADVKELATDVVSRGYRPKIFPNGELITNQGGDVLCTRPLQISQKIERAQQEESRRRVAEVTKEAQQRSSAIRRVESGSKSELIQTVETPNDIGENVIKEEQSDEEILTLKPGEI
jgi:hypothetical protein